MIYYLVTCRNSPEVLDPFNAPFESMFLTPDAANFVDVMCSLSSSEINGFEIGVQASPFEALTNISCDFGEHLFIQLCHSTLCLILFARFRQFGASRYFFESWGCAELLRG